MGGAAKRKMGDKIKKFGNLNLPTKNLQDFVLRIKKWVESVCSHQLMNSTLIFLNARPYTNFQSSNNTPPRLCRPCMRCTTSFSDERRIFWHQPTTRPSANQSIDWFQFLTSPVNIDYLVSRWIEDKCRTVEWFLHSVERHIHASVLLLLLSS